MHRLSLDLDDDSPLGADLSGLRAATLKSPRVNHPRSALARRCVLMNVPQRPVVHGSGTQVFQLARALGVVLLLTTDRRVEETDVKTGR